ncbi:MAG: hypothetical protein ACFE0Q_21565 [Anaerolineae bacterium]
MSSLYKKLLAVGLLLTLTTAQAFAQEAVEGRVVSQQDWIDRMPVIIAILIITVLIDVVFVMAFRKNDHGKDGGAQ